MGEPSGRRWESWTGGRPVLGLYIRGVGLTRYAFAALGWAAVPWALALAALVQFINKEPGAPYVTDRGFVIPAELTAMPMILCFVLGLVCGVVAFTTYRAWGRWMTTRHRPPDAPVEPRPLVPIVDR